MRGVIHSRTSTLDDKQSFVWTQIRFNEKCNLGLHNFVMITTVKC